MGRSLSADNRCQLYVPPGFAHGFCTESDVAEVLYQCTDFYRPEDERGILWNDPDIAIAWPIADPVLSDRDGRNPRLRDAELPE